MKDKHKAKKRYCMNCDKIFYRIPSKIGMGAVVCSRECFFEYRRKFKEGPTGLKVLTDALTEKNIRYQKINYLRYLIGMGASGDARKLILKELRRRVREPCSY